MSVSPWIRHCSNVSVEVWKYLRAVLLLNLRSLGQDRGWEIDGVYVFRFALSIFHFHVCNAGGPSVPFVHTSAVQEV